MLAMITPDGSLVFSVAEGTVRLDAEERVVHVRTKPFEVTGGAAVWASLSFDEAEFRSSLSEDKSQIYFQIVRPNGERFELGLMPVGEISRQLTRAIEQISGRPVTKHGFSAAYHEQETRRIDHPSRRVPVDDLYLDIEVELDEPEPTIPIDLEARRSLG